MLNHGREAGSGSMPPARAPHESRLGAPCKAGKPTTGRPSDITVAKDQAALSRRIMVSKQHALAARKMAKAKRVRTGCLTCRERHLKCDEAVPDCVNCRRSNRCCRRGLRLNFLDTMVHIPSSQASSRHWAGRPALCPRVDMLLTRQLSSTLLGRVSPHCLRVQRRSEALLCGSEERL